MMNGTLNATAVERAAFENETYAQVAESLGMEAVTLRAVLEADPTVQAAWDRGRFLRRVKDLAGVAITVSQAGRELEMDGPAFRRLLDTDAEVAAVWDQERRRLRRTAAEAVIRNAERGSKSAARYVENFLRAEQTGPGAIFDYQRVSVNVMIEITGKSRQTLYNWTRDCGCPRNPDCTYNVAEVFRWIQARAVLKRPSVDVAAQVRRAVRSELKPLVEALGATSAASQDQTAEDDSVIEAS